MAEDDVYDASGNQVDDVNTVLEYIRVQLGYDQTPDDEDDDSGQNFHLVKIVDYDFQQTEIAIEQSTPDCSGQKVYSEYLNTKLAAVSFDIITPPPEV